MANRINFQIGYTVDKAGLTEMQSLFQQIANMAKEPGNQLKTGLQQAAATANTLDQILEKTFNTNLGTLNVTKFNQELNKSGLTLKQVQTDLSKVGNQGATAYNRLAQAVLGTNLQLKQSSKLLDDMADTLTKTVKWGLASSLFNNVTNSIQRAYTYSKQLDTSLNDIRIVTDKSAENMDRFAESANEAAKQMGASTLDYTNAALIYYQQGLSDEETAARAETTIKAANVTGQTGEAVSQQLTAVWNGYKATAEETELYVDKLAAVAATTAADLEELSLGMSKVASAANAMGVDFDDLNAQIATIVSVTRQAPESVGTALKTIYARLGDLKVDGVDEFGVKLGEVSSQLETMGIQILDQNGNMRDMTSVMTEVAEKWNTWTRAQQQAAAVAMAGKRQYNNLVALFENWDMYSDALETSANAMGTLQHQQDIYMESTEAKLKTLKATWQDLYKGIIDEDELNTGIEALTNLVQVFDNFFDSFGGGIKSISAFGAVIANIFNKQIISGINNAIQRQEIFKQNLALAETSNIVRQQGALSAGNDVKAQAIEANTQKQIEYSQKIYDARAGLSQEEANILIEKQKQIGALEEEVVYSNAILEKKQQEADLTDAEVQRIQSYTMSIDDINAKYGLMTEEIRENEQRTREASNLISTEYKKGLQDSSNVLNGIAEILSAIGNENKIIVNSSSQEQKRLEEIQNEIIQATDKTSVIKKYEKEILDLTNKIKQNYKEEVNEQDKRNKAAAEYVKTLEQSRSKKEQQNNLEQEAEALLRVGDRAATVAQRVTTITSSLSTLAMAWSSVNSLFDTFADDSISWSDKITQAIMTLGMSIPMIISSFTKLDEAMLAGTAARKQLLKLDAEEAIMQVTLAGGRRTKVQGIVDETVARTAENEKITESLILEEIERVSKEKGVVLSKKEAAAIMLGVKAKLADSGANVTDITTTNLLTIAKTKLLAIVKKVTAAIMANPWLAALAALAIAIGAITKAIEKWHEAQKKQAEETLENAKSTQEVINKNEELYKSYEKLYNQYQAGDNVKQDLYNTTLKLAEAYDIEGARILALSDKYDELNARIKEAREKELSDLQESYSEGAEAASTYLAHDMSKGAGYISGDRYKATISNSIDENTANWMKEVGLGQYFQVDESGAYTFVVDIDIRNPEEMEKYLSDLEKFQTIYKQQTGKIFEPIQKELDQATEYRAQLEEQLAGKYQAEVDLKISQNSENLKGNTQEIYQTILNIKGELKNIVPNDKIDDLIKNSLSGIEDIENEIAKINLAEAISDKTGEDVKEIIDSINDLDPSQLGYLAVHLDQATLTGDLEEWINSKKPILEYEEKIGASSALGTALENYDDKKGFKEEDLAKVMSSSQATSYMGITTEQFNAEDEANQLGILTNAWIKSTKDIIEHRNDLEETLRNEQEQLREEEEIYVNNNDTIIRFFKNAISGNEELSKEQKKLEEALKSLAINGFDSLDDSQQGLILKYEELTGAERETSKEIGKYLNQVDSYEDSINSLESEINSLKNTTADYASYADLFNKEIELQNKLIDNIQSAYSSLNSIVEDYNETGAWTIDNVQQLISMDDKYVASLEFENGQLVLNEQAFQAMTLAKLDDIEATIDAEYQTKMLAIAEKDESLAAAAAAAASIAAGSDMLTMGENALSAAEGVKILADTLKEIGDPNSEYAALAEQTEKAWENRKKAIEDARNSIKKGGSSMKSAMGVKKSKSGGKDKKEKEGKEYKDEFDRYWDIKKAIDAVERALSKLDKQQEKLYGYELIKSLKLENQLLDQQAANYKALAEAQREEATELQNILAGYGVTFDASGAITNYAAATAAALQQYNQAIQMYNAGLLSESALGVYEKNYEAFKKALERYDTLYYTEMKETQEKLEEIRRKQLENNLKAWETEIQIKLDMKELERQWNDFMKEITEDFKKVYKDLRVDLKTMLKDAKTYIGKDGTLGTIIKAVQDVTKEIDKMRHGGSSDMFESISQAQEKLKELNDQLLDSAKALHDLWEEAWDNYLDGIDQVADKFDDLTDRFEKINDELEFQKELIELLYGEEAYGLMNKLYAGQQHNMEEQLKSLKQQKDMWEDLFYASGATLENQTEWTADQQKYYEEWMEAQGDLNDLVLEYIQLLKDDYLNTVKDVLKQFENMVTGGKGLSSIQEQWERISDRAEKYYDSVEGAYEIQKLANEIDKSIANTANLKNQQKLQALREREIGYLREKDNLTKYDLEAAEARYQIALKEMALEDARNNKNSMKLTRNAQGNWSYQYIADEEDVGDKQQDLLQAYSQLYQLASEAYEKNLESLIELEQTYQEKTYEINEKYIEDEKLKEQKLLELEAWYQEEKDLLAEENTLYRNDLEEGASALLLEIYRQDEEAYEAMNEKERTLLDSLVNAHISGFMDLQDKLSTNYNNIGIKAGEVMAFIRADWLSGAQEIADIWNSDDGASVKMQILATHEAISQATKRYQELVDVCANIIERDFSEQGIAGAIIRAEQETDSLSNKTVQLVNTSKPYLDDLRKYVDQIGAAWRAVQGDIKNAIKLIQEYLKYIGDVKAAVDSLNNGGGAYPGGVAPDGGGSGPGKGGSGDDKLHYDIIDDPNGVPGTKAIVKMDENRNIRQYIIIDSDANINKIKGKYGLATGGYTGSWNGSDGKFAMLHQKELVLNADDTKNFLSGINMIRDMSNVNGSIEKSILQSVANMVMSLGNIKAGSVNTNSNVTNNENGNVFNITAEFPNANDVNEIREAILTLPNLASQYVNKNAI